MLKFTYPIGLALTAAVGLPAALNQQSLQGSPEEALTNTLSAIDELLLISDALERREAGSIQRVLDMTQPPIAPPAQQDAFLAQLREEVGQLRTALAGGVVHTSEGLQPRIQLYGDPTGLVTEPARPIPGTTGATIPAPARAAEDSATSDDPEGLATGAEAVQDSDGQPSHEAVPTMPAPARELPSSAKASLEAEGYSADSLRQGRLLFRANRFEAAIAVLSGLPGEPEAEYWVARSYEALGNEHEATVRYRRLAEKTDGDEYIARRAQHDLSFLEWKQRFKDQKQK